MAEEAAAVVSLLGILVTLTTLSETKGKSLEELNPDFPDADAARAGSNRVCRPAGMRR
jgi:hypothetical protein